MTMNVDPKSSSDPPMPLYEGCNHLYEDGYPVLWKGTSRKLAVEVLQGGFSKKVAARGLRGSSGRCLPGVLLDFAPYPFGPTEVWLRVVVVLPPEQWDKQRAPRDEPFARVIPITLLNEVARVTLVERESLPVVYDMDTGEPIRAGIPQP